MCIPSTRTSFSRRTRTQTQDYILSHACMYHYVCTFLLCICIYTCTHKESTKFRICVQPHVIWVSCAYACTTMYVYVFICDSRINATNVRKLRTSICDIHAHTQHIHTYIHTKVRKLPIAIHAIHTLSIPTYIHTYIHAYIYIHTYTHTHTHTKPVGLFARHCGESIRKERK